jgi:transcription initiation factor TFIIIB Brf1 subunit/transcription initiation factor TFIIB
MGLDIKKVKFCPECGSNRIRKNVKKQQIICRECGLIYETLSPKEEKRFKKASEVV